MKKIFVSSNLNIELVSKYFDIVEKFDSNVDLAIQTDVSFSSCDLKKIKSSGIKLLGIERFNKIEQSRVLENYNINHPKSYYNPKNFDPLNSIDLFNSYIDLDEFVVKPIDGARGIGVKKITREDYKKCLYDQKNIESIFSEERKFIEKHYDDIHSSYINSSFGALLFQEPIDVSREFRLIIFKNSTSIAYEREKTEGQFCGNLSHGSTSKNVDDKTFKKYLQPLINDFQKVMDDFSYPWLSIDVYVDKNEKVGVFEFQMEFAYDGFSHILVKETMKNSIESYFK